MPFHKDLTGSDLHEPKGFGTAAANKVYVTDGAGSGTFEDHLTLGDINITSSFALVLEADTTAVQNPVGLDSTLQVNFGPAVGSGVDPVSVDASGNITINEAGTYVFRIRLQWGRTAGAGTAILHERLKLNGVVEGEATTVKLNSPDVIFDTDMFFHGTFSIGDVITAEIVRDPAGNNSGGLLPGTSTATGWVTSPSARLRVGRLSYAV